MTVVRRQGISKAYGLPLPVRSAHRPARRVRFFFTLLPHILATEKAHPGDGRQGDGAMQEHIRERVLTLSNYIIESGATVRQTATKYGISKSTVHTEVMI